MEQGSKEWLEWRKTRVTGTDAGVLSGHSKFQTLDGLFKEKIGKKKPKAKTAAMQRGIDEEPKARALLEIMFGFINIKPLICERESPFPAAASLDGVFDSGSGKMDTLIEIKCPSSPRLLHLIQARKIPGDYYAQIQYQFFVSGIKRGIYAVYDGREINYMEVMPDYKFLLILIKRCKAFAKCIENKTIDEIDISPIPFAHGT